jgi:hypothetical protein
MLSDTSTALPSLRKRVVSRGAEQALALRMMVARRDGAAMFQNLTFERQGFGVRFRHHLRKRARQYAGFAACFDRNDGFSVACVALNRLGQLDDLPGQRSRDQKGQ